MSTHWFYGLLCIASRSLSFVTQDGYGKHILSCNCLSGPERSCFRQYEETNHTRKCEFSLSYRCREISIGVSTECILLVHNVYSGYSDDSGRRKEVRTRNSLVIATPFPPDIFSFSLQM